MMWSVFQDLLQGKSSQDSLGSTFLTISKKVDDAAMANKEYAQFRAQDINQIKSAPQVQDVGMLSPANFKVSASIEHSPSGG